MGGTHARTNRKLIAAIAVVVLIVGAAFLYLQYRKATPFSVEAQFLSVLERRDWGAMYDISVQQQFERSGTTKAEFVLMMDAAAEGLPDKYFQDATLEKMGPKEDDYSRGVHAVFLTFRNGPTVEGALVEQVLHVKRSAGGWRIAINELPFRLARLHGDSVEARWDRLATSMERAGIEEFWMGVDGPVLRADLIRQHLAGNIPVDKVYIQVPRGG